MASKKLYWNTETDFFGTKVWLGTKDKSINHLIVENLTFNPVSKFDKKLKTGYLFRNPTADMSELKSVFDTIEVCEGPVNLWAEYDPKKENTVVYARLQDKSDATMFAFAQVETFQKWSDAQDKEAKTEAKKKPQKLKINKDGTVTVKVVATTLADDTKT